MPAGTIPQLVKQEIREVHTSFRIRSVARDFLSELWTFEASAALLVDILIASVEPLQTARAMLTAEEDTSVLTFPSSLSPASDRESADKQIDKPKAKAHRCWMAQGSPSSFGVIVKSIPSAKL